MPVKEWVPGMAVGTQMHVIPISARFVRLGISASSLIAQWWAASRSLPSPMVSDCRLGRVVYLETSAKSWKTVIVMVAGIRRLVTPTCARFAKIAVSCFSLNMQPICQRPTCLGQSQHVVTSMTLVMRWTMHSHMAVGTQKQVIPTCAWSASRCIFKFAAV